MKIDSVALMSCGIIPAKAELYAPYVNETCERFNIDTKDRVAMFLAQAMVESSNFTQMEEGLFYRDPVRIQSIFRSANLSIAEAQRLAGNPKALANRVYANRYGNGDEASGDGFRFRGRGAFQITFQVNYLNCGKAIDIDLIKEPDRVKDDPRVAMLSAGWYYDSKNLNRFADALDVTSATRLVNSALLHLKERQQAFDRNRRSL